MHCTQETCYYAYSKGYMCCQQPLHLQQWRRLFVREGSCEYSLPKVNQSKAVKGRLSNYVRSMIPCILYTHYYIKRLYAPLIIPVDVHNAIPKTDVLT